MNTNDRWETADGLMRLDECVAVWAGLSYGRLRKWALRGIVPVAARQRHRIFVLKRDVEKVLSERAPELLND